MANFKPGDVVMLKSGGPYMTVSFVVQGSNHGELLCHWFDGPVLYNSTFLPNTLKAVEEPVASPNDPEG
jgi:uncharacterized protein YodC (DUF2158 family)